MSFADEVAELLGADEEVSEENSEENSDVGDSDTEGDTSADSADSSDADDSDDEDSQGEESVTPDAGSNKKMVPLKALHEERREKKEYRKKVEELERKILEIEKRGQSQPEAPKEKVKYKVDVDKLLENPTEVFDEYEKYIQNNAVQERFTASVEDARLTFDDYDEVIKDFDDWFQQNPAEANLLVESRVPAKYAYKKIKSWAAKRDNAIDSSEYDRLMEENRLLREKLELSSKERPSPPPKIGSSRGVGKSGGSISSDNNDISTVFSRKY